MKFGTQLQIRNANLIMQHIKFMAYAQQSNISCGYQSTLSGDIVTNSAEQWLESTRPSNPTPLKDLHLLTITVAANAQKYTASRDNSTLILITY